MTWTAPGRVRAAAEAARTAPSAPNRRAIDVLLDAFAPRLTQGYVVATAALTRDESAGVLEAGHQSRARTTAGSRHVRGPRGCCED